MSTASSTDPTRSDTLSRSLPAWLNRWQSALAPAPLDVVIDSPSTTAVFAVDMVVGSCKFGPRASSRLGSLIDPVTDLMQRLYDRGVREYVLLQDAEDRSALEYSAFQGNASVPPIDATTVPELQRLPFADTFTTIPKDSLHPAIGTGLSRWLAEHSRIDTVVIMGTGTDLGVYQTAMHLRLRAMAMNLDHFRVIVPANAVDTYNLYSGIARMNAMMPHPADFFHPVFLYHLSLNGVEVVGSLEHTAH